MKDKLLIFTIALAGALAGANVQPVLTGAGKLLFPENATPATISASSGALTAAAGGSNQNVILTPSGTGIVTTGSLFDSTSQFRATGHNFPSSGTGAELFTLSGGAWLVGYNRTGSAYVPLNINGSPVIVNSDSGASVGIGVTPSYKLDVFGDVNTSGVYRVGGSAGQSVTVTLVKGTPAAGQSNCTIILTGGIKTGGSC